MSSRKRRDDDAEDNSAIQLSEDPKEVRRKVWMRAFVSEVETWDKAAKAAGMKTGPWLRALANRAAALANTAVRQK